MNTNLPRNVASAFVVLILVGCASVAPVDHQEDGSLAEPAPGKDVSIVRPVTIDRSQVLAESSAVKYLLDDAEQAMRVEDYSRAQALVERALRIERKTPRAYLISALVQKSTGEVDSAADLARQGLLYTPETSEIHRRLKDVLSSLGI